MDVEVQLDRGGARGISLSPEETALLNEVTIEPEAPIRRNPIKRAKRQRKVQFQEAMEEADDDDDVGAFMNPGKSSAEAPPPPVEFDHHQGGMEESDSDEDGPSLGGGGAPGGGYGEQPGKGYSSIDDEKADLLNKLTRLEKKGYNVNKKLNAYSPVQDLRTEVKRIVYSIEVEQSVKFSRRTMVACVTGLEFLNKRYNPLEVQLDGWSESVMENLDDYDGVFEELHTKYKGKMEVAPEVRMLMMLGGSAMMFHLTNSMFKAAVPNVNDILKQNPGLAASMVDAVKNSRPGGSGVPPPPAPPMDTGGRREMQGPGLDLSSLMGGFGMGPPPPMTSRPEPVEVKDVPRDDDNASISDIVSTTSTEIREVNTGDGSSKKRRGRPPGSKNKKELSL
jgi:hypothetical protein